MAVLTMKLYARLEKEYREFIIKAKSLLDIVIWSKDTSWKTLLLNLQ